MNTQNSTTVTLVAKLSCVPNKKEKQRMSEPKPIISLEEKTITCLEERKKSLQARYSYGIVFLLTNLGAWFFRDYGDTLLPQLHYIKDCDCFHTMGVLRVSLGCFVSFSLSLSLSRALVSLLLLYYDNYFLTLWVFLNKKEKQIFFFLMFLTTCKTSKLYEARNTWHTGWWALKIVILIVSLVLPFFFSSDIIQLYGELARVGAGIFLILQLISVIQFISWWNNYWMPDDEKSKSCSLGLFMSTLFYIASICGIVWMYPLYAPKALCALNIFFITWTAVLLIVMMLIALHSKVNRGLLSSGIMASYVVFLCWSALRSEPAIAIGKCSSQKQANGNVDWTTVLSFLIAISAIVMATFSTGIDSQSFQFRKDDLQSEDDIPYKYGFFHLIFSLGAMYFAMLFINWNLKNTASKWSIDVGWASTWVKIVNQWFAATIYLWKLMYPVVVKVREDHEESIEIEQTHNLALP